MTAEVVITVGSQSSAEKVRDHIVDSGVRVDAIEIRDTEDDYVRE